MKGVAFLLLVVVLVCCGVENGCGISGAPVSRRFPLGAIGCLFSKHLCGPEQECIDDRLFGTCQDRQGAKDRYKYLLNRSTLKALQEEIVFLIQNRFSWRDALTQCRLQNMLFSYREQTDFDESLCFDSPQFSEDAESDISKVLQRLLNFYRYGDQSNRDLQNNDERYVSDYNSQKRDEFLKIHKYFDPSKGQWKRRVDDSDYAAPPTFQDYLVEKEVGSVLRDASRGSLGYDVDLSEDDINRLRVYLQALRDVEQIYDIDDSEEASSPVPDDVVMEGQTLPGNSGAFWSSPEVTYPVESSEEEVQPLPGVDLSILHRGDNEGNNLYAFPDTSASSSPEINNSVSPSEEGLEEANNEISEAGLTPRYAKLLADLLQDDLDPSRLSNRDLGQLTGIVNRLLRGLAKDKPMEAEVVDLEPADQSDVSSSNEESPTMGSLSAEDMGEEEMQDKRLSTENGVEKKADKEEPESDNEPADSAPTEAPPGGTEQEDQALGVVDATNAYITVDKDISLKEGEQLVGALASSLQIPPSTFSVTNVHNDRVTFQISPELLETTNATSIAAAAGTHKAELLRLTGLTVAAAGIGSPDGGVEIQVFPSSALADNASSPKFFVLTFVLCGCIAGVLIGVVVIYLVKRHSRSKDKLAQLASEVTGAEASQDYQDLCRQRMQSKTSEKPEPLHAAGRIGSVSESQVRSPSSRSSTSSWSEEPVTSNMDISTGHIILSYMEDHLKNKDRLHSEWEALMAYEADPCSTIVANDPSNARKNRYADSLPYDHSRVVLADSSNVSGSDYINASTITDHDPRNPAYIVTQGPLPHTVADFWQMVWEQGSVVVVMLTKLTENGAAMCHRYWPEEGSDLYHIYEVHLVSEHIWCEDYLVRSFYLKNLQTNETRTVTQFHFLTWIDNKAPSSTKALLDFRRKVNKSYRGRSCPIVVHCSDGTGRSGTYTLVDMVLNRLAKGAKEIDIAATLEHIRDQRMGMVKTKEQFEFALGAVADEVHAILKSLPQ